VTTDEQSKQPVHADEPIEGEDLTDEERQVLKNVAGSSSS
jgi:hypothetical protein